MKFKTKIGISYSLGLLKSVPLLLLICSIPYEIVGAPPESIGIPIIKSMLDGKSSEGLKDLMHAHSSKLLSHLSGTDASQASPAEINNLINKLKPTKGKLDPVVTDVLSALDRTYRDTTAAAAAGESSTEQFPNEAASNRIASSTEENNIIWQGTTYRPRKRERESTKFSSRYRSTNKNNTPSPTYNGSFHSNASSDNATEHGDSSLLPFNHVTDPNLRNHRLYDWEFETYKNFTHIDQAEDLMAEEDHATETKVSVVTAVPPPGHPSQQHSSEKAEKSKEESNSNNSNSAKTSGTKSKRVKVKGIPHIVISLEDTSDHGYRNGHESYNVHLPLDSGEHSLHQRPREPLRHSSTENIVYVHGDSGEEDRYPYSALREPTHMQDADDRYADGRSPNQFRPSAADLSDTVFMDPDQDFFTSTVKNNGNYHMSEQEISSETLPKRRRKKLKKITKKEEMEELAQAASRFNNRIDDDAYRANQAIHYSPEYSKNSLQGNAFNEDRARAHLGNIHHNPGPHLPLMKPTKYSGLMESTRMKSDRVLTAGDNLNEYGMMNQGQQMNPSYDQFDSSMHHHDGGIGNYYSLHSDPGLHSNLGPTAPEPTNNPYGHKNNYDLTSTEYLGTGNRLQNALSALNLNNLFGGQHATKKLQAAVADQVIAPGNIEDFYHPYAASDHQVNQYYEDSYATSWSNTWFILAGLIAFTAIFALMLPLFLSPGRMGKKDHRHDLDDDDLNSDYTGSSSNNNYHYDNTNNDINQNSDMWTEIKGVYNDLLSMFRGEYGILSKIRKDPDQGPKIVYRDEDMEEEDSDEEDEDDEKTDNRVNLRNRKRDQYLKKQQQILQKQQQQELKREQLQQQQQQQQQTLQNQAKSHTLSKKTLVSKIKAEAARDNKDGKTIQASSVNNLVVVSGPGGPMGRKIEDEEEEHSSPRAVTGFVLPENGTLATMTMPFVNTTGYVNPSDSFLREWAQVQLINNH